MCQRYAGQLAAGTTERTGTAEGWGTGMAFLDRDYYRDEGSGPLAMWLQRGLITKILVAVSILVYIVQINTDHLGGGAGPVTEALSLIGLRVLHGEVWRLFTYSFLHTTSALLPFLVEIPLFWVIGHEVEEQLGRRRYGIFLVAASLAGALAVVGAARLGVRGVSFQTTPVVGCSGAIAAMLIWLILQSPRQSLTFFYALTLPAWLVLALSLVMDAWGLVWARDERSLTLANDLGGLLFAIAFFGAARTPWPRATRRRSRGSLSDSDLRIFREESKARESEAVPAPVPSSSDVDEHLEAQLDAVLAKVAEHGQDSLTGAERAILNRAAEVYRKRRR
jgi:membrane associated rhomboid family serine protease